MRWCVGVVGGGAGGMGVRVIDGDVGCRSVERRMSFGFKFGR